MKREWLEDKANESLTRQLARIGRPLVEAPVVDPVGEPWKIPEGEESDEERLVWWTIRRTTSYLKHPPVRR